MTALLDLAPRPFEADAAYTAFAGWAEGRGLPLYPAQDEALIEIVSGANVVLSTPTGTGKSLVAVAAHFTALAQGGRSYYTAPIKALVSEKFFALVDIFGAENVGMVTGDSSVNADAPIICCTAEILANLALRQGADADVDQVVMDEFHFYADPERGWAWQVPLLTLPRAQFILMSATLGDMKPIADDLSKRTGRETALITGVDRPVPLHYSYVLTPVHETVEELLHTGQSPVYIVHFSQAAALEHDRGLGAGEVGAGADVRRHADARSPGRDGDAVVGEGRGQRARLGLHVQQVVVAGGRQIVGVHPPRDKGDAVPLHQRQLVDPARAQPFAAGAFDEAQVVGVIDHLAQVGVLVIDPDGQAVGHGAPSLAASRSAWLASRAQGRNAGS